MTRQNITKAEIAEGYDAIAEIVGIGNQDFYEACAKTNPFYYGHVLDIGCGRGLLLQTLRKYTRSGTKLYGIDISPKLVELASINNPGAKIVVGDAEKLPYPDNMFEFVFMTEALEHMLDFDKVLSEIRRVLRPKGIFVVTVPNRDWASYDFYDKIRNHEFQPVDDHYFKFSEISDLLKRHTFRIQTYKGLDNLYYYGWKHKVEELAAFFLPFLHRKMKRLLFKCINEK